MCQYSAKKGVPTDWHYRHLSNLIMSGAGLLMLESTAVMSKGRISKKIFVLRQICKQKEFKKLIKHLKK